MKLLLDTHTFIWWDSDPGRLSSTALTALQDPTNEVWLSVASVLELVIKSKLGKLSLRLPLADVIAEQQANGLSVLPLTLAHTLAVVSLPPVHKDPFDRLLVAQSKLVSVVPILASYPVKLLW